MKPTEEQINRWRQRSYSWSQHSSFSYSPEQWYSRYILGEATPETPSLKFGKALSESVEWGTPMAPCLIYKSVEHKLEGELDGLKLVGYMDSYDPDELKMCELKTGEKKWTADRVDKHQQLDFYAMILYMSHKVRPEDLHITLQWMPTGTRSDFTFGFILDKEGKAQIHSFETRRTMLQILKMCADIKKTRSDMEAYIKRI